jgi:hypothetical protein
VKFISKVLPENFPLLGGKFGPRENNICQTAAMASGGMSSVFISAFPAMYQLNLMDTPRNDYWKIVALTAVSGYFGYFFATPSTFCGWCFIPIFETNRCSAQVLHHLRCPRASFNLSYRFCYRRDYSLYARSRYGRDYRQEEDESPFHCIHICCGFACGVAVCAWDLVGLALFHLVCAAAMMIKWPSY